jgi:hypothetical protein
MLLEETGLRHVRILAHELDFEWYDRSAPLLSCSIFSVLSQCQPLKQSDLRTKDAFIMLQSHLRNTIPFTSSSHLSSEPIVSTSRYCFCSGTDKTSIEQEHPSQRSTYDMSIHLLIQGVMDRLALYFADQQLATTKCGPRILSRRRHFTRDFPVSCQTRNLDYLVGIEIYHSPSRHYVSATYDFQTLFYQWFLYKV